MRHLTLAALAAATILAGSAGAARADVYNGVYSFAVTEGVTGGNGFATVNVNPFPASSANTTGATFTYTGPLNFVNTTPQNTGTANGDLNSNFGFSVANVSNYAGGGSIGYGNTVVYNGTTVANFSTLTGFLGSSGSSGNFQWGSLYAIDLGVVVAGTVLTINHDDGASLYQGGTQIGTTAIGPTSVVTDTVQVASTADTYLLYSRQNGTPSILQVAVPEPVSMSLLGAGLIGLGMIRRRKARAV